MPHCHAAGRRSICRVSDVPPAAGYFQPDSALECFAFEHICRPDPVFRLAGFTLPPEQPQVNCGDTGEGELRDAPGRQREARYGQGERRGISPCPAPWSTS